MWIETAGFRALPPSDKPTSKMMAYWSDVEDNRRAVLFEDPGSAAIVRSNVLGRHVMNIIDLRQGGPWNFPSNRVSDLNRNLRGSVVVIARRAP
jgi:hypothetical protein